jgi:hypothetical protein
VNFKPAIFLDIDGVLNAPCTKSTRYQQRCVMNLRHIVNRTGAEIVLSSTWRLMINSGAMTLRGFSILLHTHGALCSVVGVLPPEKSGISRAAEITNWLRKHGKRPYVVLDDDDDGMTQAGHPFEKTSRMDGLSRRGADRAIRLLKAQMK